MRAFDWFKEAEDELESSKILLEHSQYHHACFHAQQAGEKAIKATLRKFHIAKYGHSILELLEELKKHVILPQKIKEAAKILDQYYIPSRYPNAFSSGSPSNYYTESQAKDAFRLAKEVVEFARRILFSP
ncbi:MAG: HEPN domain-containing protein [Candidatus Wukongarchaeota archaeon]|nr:HEPN domain-containing protein [Candidatus Wukongarchaeota archaeon]